MSETINRSRNLGYKKNFSGIKAVGFLPDTKLTLAPSGYFEGGGMTASGTTASVYRYTLKNDGNSYSEEIASDRNTGTTVYTGTLALTLPTLDKETRDQIKLLAYGISKVFLEAYDGKIYLMGYEHGCELTAGTIATGAARTDLSGYTLTLMSTEREPLVELGATGSTIYNSAVNLTNVINPQ